MAEGVRAGEHDVPTHALKTEGGLGVSNIPGRKRVGGAARDGAFDILGQIELFADFGPVDSQVWRSGRRLADRDFRA
jgi:hypothetical protein